jgi:hypothetical protein
LPTARQIPSGPPRLVPDDRRAVNESLERADRADHDVLQLIATNGDRRGDQEMTTAQNTIQWGGSNRLVGFAAAATAGLIVAVVGVAISARPVVAPAAVPAPAPAPALMIIPIDPSLRADTHSEALRLKAAQAEAAKQAADAAASWPVVPTITPITPRQELDDLIQEQIHKH